MKSNITCKCNNNYPIANLTTLKIGGTAQRAYFPSCIEELISIRDEFISNGEQMVIIGAGSNLLVSSAGVSNPVVFTKELDFIESVEDGAIVVGSGVKSVKLAKFAQEKGLTGLEFLVGIPGSVGGAVTMNSSAHGQAIKDVIKSVKVMNIETGEISVLAKDELELDYRTSFVKQNRHVILEAVFELKKGNADEIEKLMDFHVNYRMENHPPLTEPSAGSTFRNPEKGAYVGKMFQELGLKGFVQGGAKVSEKHANFIINTGDATSADVSKLMQKMHSGVKEKYGYDLIAEIRYIGDMTKEEEEIWKNFQVH